MTPRHVVVRDIDRVGFGRMSANRVNLFRDVPCVCFRAAHTRHPRSLICQSQGNGLSNTAPCAGNDRNVTLKSHMLFR